MCLLAKTNKFLIYVRSGKLFEVTLFCGIQCLIVFFPFPLETQVLDSLWFHLVSKGLSSGLYHTTALTIFFAFRFRTFLPRLISYSIRINIYSFVVYLICILSLVFSLSRRRFHLFSMPFICFYTSWLPTQNLALFEYPLFYTIHL